MHKLNAHRDTFIVPTKGKKEVAFTFGSALNLCPDGTDISRLLEIGALLNTRRYSKEVLGDVTATDLAGLEKLVDSGHNAIEGILTGICAISKALVYASDNLKQEDISDLGWLIHGLGTIATHMHVVIADIQHEIERDFGGKTERRS